MLALEALHFAPGGEDRSPDCATACYDCLLDYYNQREHPVLNRHLVRDTLLGLSQADLGPIHAHGWEDLFATLHGPGSDNERAFLELIREAGFPVPGKAHYALPDNGAPVAEIDFRVGRAHVLVDGSIHHTRYVQEIDTLKRQQLQDAGFQIIVVDMADPSSGLDRLRRLA